MIADVFRKLDGARIGVLGDYCLDAYWRADMRKSVLSRETPHFPLPVVEERMAPGGAGNVLMNVAALRPRAAVALGEIGRDWRGGALSFLLRDAGADITGLIESPGRVTNAYIKPVRAGISDVAYEDPRLDFENYAPMGRDAEDALLFALDRAAPGLDALCVCDQMAYGCVTKRVREKICALGAAGLTVIADSRDRIGLYENVIVKPNELEAARAAGEGSFEEMALRLSVKTKMPALITLGDKGCLTCAGGVCARIPARRVEPPVDICGAGDTFLAALACALAGGASLTEAAEIANAASSVTVKMVGQTGTASRADLSALCP